MKYQARVVSASKEGLLRIEAVYRCEYGITSSRDVSPNQDGSKMEEYERRIVDFPRMQFAVEATEANQQHYHVGKVFTVIID